MGSQKAWFATLAVCWLMSAGAVQPQDTESRDAQSQDAHSQDRQPQDLTLTFGAYATDRPGEMVRKLRPLLDAIERGLEQRTGQSVRVKTQIAGDYRQGIDQLVDGRVDFVRFGVTSYVTAKTEQPDLALLAIESNRGSKQFFGIICVAAEGPIQSVEQLRGKRFAFGNELSTFGRYLSQQFLVQNGIRSSDLAAHSYLGRHDKVGAAVASGLFDAGALKESTFNKMVDQGKPLRALAKLPIVTRPWAARSDLPAPIVAALRDTLLRLEDEQALKAIRRQGFLPSSDSDFDPVRQAMEQNPEFWR